MAMTRTVARLSTEACVGGGLACIGKGERQRDRSPVDSKKRADLDRCSSRCPGWTLDAAMYLQTGMPKSVSAHATCAVA